MAPDHSVDRKRSRYENTEEWDQSVPSDLIPAIKHLRASFDTAHFGYGHTCERFCFALLHKSNVHDPANEYANYLIHMKAKVGAGASRRFNGLIKKNTPPAVFKAFFDLYLDSLSLEVAHISQELIEIGSANHNQLETPFLDWAKSQANHLVRSHIFQIEAWVRDVCDKKKHDPTEDWEEQIFWRKWQAPMFLIMEPSRYQPYDAEKAWDRADSESSGRWLESFAETYVLRFQGLIQEIVGRSALELAKQPAARPDQATENAAPAKPSTLTARISRRDLQKRRTEERYERWRVEYGEQKKRQPGMSDVWYAQKIARLDVSEGYSEDTIRKHMKK